KPGYEQSYGYTRIFDIKDKTNPKLLSEFKTDLTEDISENPAEQVTFWKTVHDPKVLGNTLYLSHYAGGVRTVEISSVKSVLNSLNSFGFVLSLMSKIRV
ncbi:hypothetical protein ACW7EJ_09215, partial [Acinetobacter soli]